MLQQVLPVALYCKKDAKIYAVGSRSIGKS